MNQSKLAKAQGKQRDFTREPQRSYFLVFKEKNSLESETLYFLLKHNRKKTMTSLTTMEEILHPQRIEVCLVLILK